ncbi:MAG: hypothetical protein HFJ87_05000 [Muribaculaceae bacterium]|nr:hypothetical protein [Muribaculaceae bacterium]MCI9054486.1 hypothetical protein [Muribaculaceae bacterium]
MKKTIVYKAMALMTAMAMSVSLASCGDDNKDGDDPVADNSVSKVVISYNVSLADTWYTFYDVQVTYANVGGTEVTESLDMDWNYTMTLTDVEFPTHYACKVVAKPKADAPAPEADEMYRLDTDITCSVMGYAADGSAISYGDDTQNIGKSQTKGSSLVKALGSEHTLINFVYDVK